MSGNDYELGRSDQKLVDESALKLQELVKAKENQLRYGEEYTYEPYRTLWLELKSLVKESEKRHK